MSIRPFGKNKWQIDYYPMGAKGKRERVTFHGNESSARAYEAELRRNNQPILLINPKLMDIIPDYLAWLQMHRSKETYRGVTHSIKYLIAAFGNVQFSRLAQTLIEQYKKDRSKKVGNKTINNELTYLQSLINYAVKNKHAHPLPFKIEKLPFSRPVPQIPHPQEVEDFIGQINGKDMNRKKALVRLLWECGLRWSEARHIRWEDIDWLNEIVYLKITKGNRPRTADLTPNIRALLEPFKKDSGWVFENSKTGLPWQSFKNLFKYGCKRAGVRKLYPHLLRHAFGTYSLEASEDLRLVQTMLGHRDIKTTQWYTQIATHRLKKGTRKTLDYISQLKPLQLNKINGKL